MLREKFKWRAHKDESTDARSTSSRRIFGNPIPDLISLPLLLEK
jgi:hypothetical protein